MYDEPKIEHSEQILHRHKSGVKRVEECVAFPNSQNLKAGHKATFVNISKYNQQIDGDVVLVKKYANFHEKCYITKT